MPTVAFMVHTLTDSSVGAGVVGLGVGLGVVGLGVVGLGVGLGVVVVVVVVGK